MRANAVDAESLTANWLLGALEPALRERLARHMEDIPLRVRDIAYETHQPIEHVVFPVDGVISIVTPIEGAPSSMVEVATVGREGLVGLPLFLGVDRTPGFAFTQVEGRGFRMPAEAFVELARSSEPFTRLLRRYTQALLVQISQSTACNRVHTVQERCARWLLMTHDRVQGDRFGLTQQFLGMMLGERRAAVNVAASAMQKAGFIRYVRGRIAVLDRAGLESASCRCYRLVREEYERMLGELACETADA
jgi:CRP-like cAMP-binding protein